MNEKNNKKEDLNYKNGGKSLDFRSFGIFHNDSQIIFVFKKTERLASAIYLLTSFLSDSEPMKWRMRDATLRLISCGVNISVQRHQGHFEAMNNFISSSLEILSMLESSKISGIISSMNYEIFKFEIEKIIELIAAKERELSSKLLLMKNLFEIPKDYSANGGEQEQAEGAPGGTSVLKSANNYAGSNQERKGQDKGQFLVKDIKDKVTNESNTMSFNKGQNIKDKGSRREIIISFLKKNKEVGIKELSAIIYGCSEKTIQRELISLVGKGVLKKEGERRWSKYSLLN